MASEKHFAPSARKGAQARREGDVAKARELAFGSVTLCICTLFWMCPPLTRSVEFFEYILREREDFTTDAMIFYVAESWKLISVELAGFFAVVLLIALVVEGLQAGLVVSFKPLVPSIDRLLPNKGFPQAWGIPGEGVPGRLPWRVIGEGTKAVCLSSTTFIGAAVAFCFFARELFALTAQLPDAELGLDLLTTASASAAGLAGAIVLLVGFCGLRAARYLRRQRLAMDIDELRREIEESEGRSEVRALRRSFAERVSENEVLQRVRSSKAVVCGRVRQ
ncbi:MAG: EscU/YscU/HrcU family type III secretion system export apparatus switch protein [Deltaproteobacteria bacterium]|nr:EscU/YscU/HrcU family type III secretion system export apparatus switch protein [Deltaproteobacteria bacterium]